jgi:hypothetical protein
MDNPARVFPLQGVRAAAGARDVSSKIERGQGTVEAFADIQPLIIRGQIAYQEELRSTAPDTLLIPQRLVNQLCQGRAKGYAWAAAWFILKQMLCKTAPDPQRITSSEFKKALRQSSMSILAALRVLQELGLLSEEVEDYRQKHSPSRYALIDTEINPAPDVFTLDNGASALILMVGHLYAVPSEKIKRRQTLPHESAHSAAPRQRACDPVIPPARWGREDDPSNLVTACGSCTASKGALTREEW